MDDAGSAWHLADRLYWHYALQSSRVPEQKHSHAQGASHHWGVKFARRFNKLGLSVGLSVFFVGNATVLIRYGGLTILTDLNFLHAAVHALKMLHPHAVIPIHYNDYDRFKSPLSDFQKAAQATGLEEKIHYLKPGETYIFHLAKT